MARQFRLRFPDGSAIAELLEAEAPVIAARWWEALPLASFATHAKFAGEEIFFGVPYLWPAENLRRDVAAGDIGYYPGRQTVCLFYGEIVPFGSVAVFARVVAGLEAIRRNARLCRQRGAVAVSAERLP